MKMKESIGVLVLTCALFLWGCEKESGPALTGGITLSSELHGTESYYINGYSFEDGQMYAYSIARQGGPLPDIINEGSPVIEDGQEHSLPGFNPPGQVNGCNKMPVLYLA